MISQLSNRSQDSLALDDLERSRTWGELDDRVCRLARWLRDDLGLSPDDHIAALMDNRVEGVELVLASMAAGVWLTPINHYLQKPEIEYVVRDSGARVLFVDDGHADLLGETPGCDPVRVGDELDRVLADASDEPMPLDGPPGMTMIYTSGTTGNPKGVKRARARTVADQFAAGAAAGRTIRMDGSGTHLVTGPLHHAAPLLFAVYDMLCGAPITVMPRWDERRALSLIAERDVRHTHLVPTMFVRLLRLPADERASFDPAPLETVLHGAAPIAPDVKRAMIDWWGPVLLEYWGATESGVATLTDSQQWIEKPGTVGKVTDNFEVFAAGDDGEPLPPGENGTLYIRSKRYGASHFVYHGDRQKTDAAYSGDAFSIGDLGYVDDDGFVFLADRKSNTIISGGVNIYPAEIEAVLTGHPDIADVAVIGVPDYEWGEQVKAVVELLPGVSPSDELAQGIRAFAAESLAKYKVPRSVDFEDELPRHPTGKLLKRLIRDRYWSERDRRIYGARPKNTEA